MAKYLYPSGLLCLVALCLPVLSFSQRPTIEDFTLAGDTYRTEDDCFRLTEEQDYSSGSIWYRRAVSLTSPFAIELSLMLGCKNETGADGMVFIFTPQPNRLGFVGEGIGFAGLVPSLGIEIDTWENEHLYDPPEDHVAILVNGRVGHFSQISKPIIIPNLEDCTRHKFAIRWQPDQQRLAVEIDNSEIVTVSQDVVNGIFGGNDVVYWGVSAATGRYNNYHEVCFDRLSQRYKPLPLPNEGAPALPAGPWAAPSLFTQPE